MQAHDVVWGYYCSMGRDKVSDPCEISLDALESGCSMAGPFLNKGVTLADEGVLSCCAGLRD